MSLRRRAAASVIAVTALLAGGLASAAPASAAGVTYFDFSGDAGDYVTGGQSYQYTSATATFGSTLATSTASIRVTTAVDDWMLLLSAPDGQDFVQGTTYQGARLSDSTHGRLDVFGNGRGCNQTPGTFTVDELGTDGLGAVTTFVVTFEQHCEGGTAASRGTIAINASKSPARLTSTTPSTAVINGPVTVSGVLTDSSGALAGAAITVSRPDGAGGTTSLDATTATDGSFSVADTIGTSDVTYTLAYAGDTSHYAVSRQITVKAVKAVSVLTLSAPTTVSRGTAYTLGGTLRSAGGAVAGATVSLTRRDVAGVKSLSVKTTSTGAFSLKDVPTVGGTVAWTASWAGTASQAAASAKRSVTVPRTATSLSITTNATSYAYGGKAVVKAKLGTTYNSRVVSIYAKRLDTGATSLIAKGRVSSTGYLSVSYTMKAKTVFTARFDGDYRYAPVGRALSRTVASRTKVTVSGSYGTSGAFRLVHVYNTAYFIAGVVPARPGQCVNFVGQQLLGGTWRTYTSYTCAPLDASSHTMVYIPGNGGTSKVRVRASVGSNSYSTGSTSAWVYVWFR